MIKSICPENGLAGGTRSTVVARSLVKGTQMPEENPEKVIVGIDGSPSAILAMEWAMRYAKRTGAAIEAVHVWQDPAAYGAPLALLLRDDAEHAAELAMNESIDERQP